MQNKSRFFNVLLFQKKLYLCRVIKNQNIMALEINRAPVLTGKAAKEFWQKVANFSTQETREELIEKRNKFRQFIATQKHFQYA